MGRAPASLRARKGRESAAAKAERARLIFQRLHQTYPDAACALDHADAYQLLVATILSAQCTDARVNMVTPAFFARYPRPEDLARADRAEVEELIRSTGFFRNKARSLVGMAQGARGGPSRRGAAKHGGAPGAAGGRSEDGERRPWKRVRNQRGNHGGHPRHPSLATARSHPARRPDTHRAGPHAPLPEGGLGPALPPPDHARATDLHRPASSLPRLRGG